MTLAGLCVTWRCDCQISWAIIPKSSQVATPVKAMNLTMKRYIASHVSMTRWPGLSVTWANHAAPGEAHASAPFGYISSPVERLFSLKPSSSSFNFLFQNSFFQSIGRTILGSFW